MLIFFVVAYIDNAFLNMWAVVVNTIFCIAIIVVIIINMMKAASVSVSLQKPCQLLS